MCQPFVEPPGVSQNKRLTSSSPTHCSHALLPPHQHLTAESVRSIPNMGRVRQPKACFPHARDLVAAEHVQQHVRLALCDIQRFGRCASTSKAFINLLQSFTPVSALHFSQRHALRLAVEDLAGTTAPVAAPSLSHSLSSRCLTKQATWNCCSREATF